MNDDRLLDLARAFRLGTLSRRRFLRSAAGLGVSVPLAARAVNAVSGEGLADGFDWRREAGERIGLVLADHLCSRAIATNLSNFTDLSGIQVDCRILPRPGYEAALLDLLNRRERGIDVVMTHPYQLWRLGPAGWVVNTNPLLDDTKETAPGYDWTGIFPAARAATAWSGQLGGPAGGAGARQWGLPIGLETTVLAYNHRHLEQAGFGPPADLEDLARIGAALRRNESQTPVVLPGTQGWLGLHQGYMTSIASFGGQDYVRNAETLIPAMGEPAADAATTAFAHLVRKAGPRGWPALQPTASPDELGAGRASFLFGSDVDAYLQNQKGAEAGNIRIGAFSPAPGSSAPTPSLFVWALALSTFSRRQAAGFKLMQWASGTEQAHAIGQDLRLPTPIRGQVWADPAFQSHLDGSLPGFTQAVDPRSARLPFTPTPFFFTMSEIWAETLGRIIRNEVGVEGGLDYVAKRAALKLEVEAAN